MDIEDILDLIDDILGKSWNLPMTGGKSVVDYKQISDLLDDVRNNLPIEIQQARGVLAERAEIIAASKREAESIVRKAEDRARALIAQEEILKQAQARATEIISKAQQRSRDLTRATKDFSDDTLKGLEESLSKHLSDVRQTRQALRSMKDKA